MRVKCKEKISSPGPFFRMHPAKCTSDVMRGVGEREREREGGRERERERLSLSLSLRERERDRQRERDIHVYIYICWPPPPQDLRLECFFASQRKILPKMRNPGIEDFS